jgi:hypothetical protein
MDYFNVHSVVNTSQPNSLLYYFQNYLCHLAGVAAFAWMLERYSQKVNVISALLNKSTTYLDEALILIVFLSLVLFGCNRYKAFN